MKRYFAVLLFILHDASVAMGFCGCELLACFPSKPCQFIDDRPDISRAPFLPSLLDVPDIGLSLSTDYGIAIVNKSPLFPRHVVKIPGDYAYKSLMQSLLTANASSFSASTEAIISALQPLLLSLKNAAESYLSTPICLASLAIPGSPSTSSLSYRALGSALIQIKANIGLDTGGLVREAGHAAAYYNGYGDWDTGFDEEKEEEPRVLSIGFSKAGMSVTRLQYEWSGYPCLEEEGAFAYYPELGLDKYQQAASVLERSWFWERVTEVLEASVQPTEGKLEEMRVREQWGYVDDKVLRDSLDFKYHENFPLVNTPTKRITRFYLHGDATEEEGLRGVLALVFPREVVERVYDSELSRVDPEIAPAMGVLRLFSSWQCARPHMPSWECGRSSGLYNEGELGGYYTKGYEKWQYLASRARCFASLFGVNT